MPYFSLEGSVCAGKSDSDQTSSRVYEDGKASSCHTSVLSQHFFSPITKRCVQSFSGNAEGSH